jgi:hypothetical protein
MKGTTFKEHCPLFNRKTVSWPNASVRSNSIHSPWLRTSSFPGRKIASCSEIHILDLNVTALIQYQPQTLEMSQVLSIASHHSRNPMDLILSLNGSRHVDRILHSEHTMTDMIVVVWREESICLGHLLSSGDWSQFAVVCLVIVWKYVGLVIQVFYDLLQVNTSL